MAAPVSFPALATGALGLTVALAWNDALRRCVAAVLPLHDGPGAAAHHYLAYAAAVTLLVVCLAAGANLLFAGLGGEKNARPDTGVPRCACSSRPSPSSPASSSR